MREPARKSHGRKSGPRSRVAASRTGARPLHKVVAVNLRRLRADNRISVEALAGKTGYAPEFVKKVVRGELPKLTLGQTEVFATALGVDITALVRRRRS